jgi:hypothetical protein
LKKKENYFQYKKSYKKIFFNICVGAPFVVAGAGGFNQHIPDNPMANFGAPGQMFQVVGQPQNGHPMMMGGMGNLPMFQMPEFDDDGNLVDDEALLKQAVVGNGICSIDYFVMDMVDCGKFLRI